MRSEPFVLDDLAPLTRAVIEWCLNVRTFRHLRAHDSFCRSVPFERAVLDALEISIDAFASDLAAIPPSGPTVIVANHPHGPLDGLVMTELVRRVRDDVRVLANVALSRVPELRDVCFFVDPFGGPSAAARSCAGLRGAHLWLRNGGALVAFPSGVVAHRLIGGMPIESPWLPTVFRLAERTGATVVRAHIDGTNSRFFYAAGRIHPMLRTALLGRELLKQRGRTVSVRIADASASIAAELEALPTDTHLVQSGSFDVFCAEAPQIPTALREIGRLREVSFRAVGEGTGQTYDLDEFDRRYLHLVLWDREHKRIVGAYRLGRTDRIRHAQGVYGLYTRTLFEYDERLLDRIGGPSLELGRSFVRAEYQKNYSPLLLLWRGIGEYIVRHPRYRFLFGPVSVSTQYRDVSHEILVAFLRQHCFDTELAELVAARRPWQTSTAPCSIIGSVEELNRAIARAEPDGKGVPVLLRQYLKLRARVIGFNIDPGFGDALDILMLVDLAQLPARMLSHYMGCVGAETFLATHRAVTASRAA
jgi:putative hemolysin